jgi:hypothetical protein
MHLQHRRQRRLLQLLLHRVQLREFLVLEIILLLQRREWEFLVRFLALEIILSHHHKGWVAQVHLDQVVLVVRLVPVVLVAQVVQVVSQERVVRLVPAVLVAQVVQVVSLVQVVQVLAAVLQAELRVPVVLVAQVVAQVQVVVAVLAVEPLVRSVRAVLAVRARLVSQSVQSAKSLNSAQMHHHLVVRLFHAETVLPSCVCVVDLQFKISQTRLTPQQVS